MECFDPNSLETRCGLPGVQEVETYCGDDASSACVEINVMQYDSNTGTFRHISDSLNGVAKNPTSKLYRVARHVDY